MDFMAIARRIRQMIQAQAQSFTDEEALDAVFAFPKWKTDTEYTTGERVRFGEDLYKVLQDHTSQDGWKPTDAPSLYAKILPGQDGEIGEWVQPDSTNPYMRGDRVRFEGRIYESLIDNNIWSPAAYPAGWMEIV